MKVLKRLMLSSKFWMLVYGLQAMLWIVTFPIAVTLWKESVVYLIFLSQLTALTGALGGYASSLAERKADPRFPEDDPEVADTDPM